MKPSMLPALAALLFSSCSSWSDHAGSPSACASPAPGESRSERIVRKDGRMSMKSRALEDSVTKCVALVESHRGILQNAELTEDAYEAIIRVPATHLEPLMDSLAGIGRVTSRRVSVDDVTAEYRDLEAEIANTRALRDRLRLLLIKATTIKDTLAIEKELARVQAELDVLEGRMRLLRSQVARSTLRLHIGRERIPGPLGAVAGGTRWTVRKLFVWN